MLKLGRDDSVESKLDKREGLLVIRYGRPQADVRLVASGLSFSSEQCYVQIQMTPQMLKNEILRTLRDIMEAAARKQVCALLF